MRPGKGPWGNYTIERFSEDRSVLVYRDLQGKEQRSNSMATDVAEERCGLFASQDWIDYGNGKKGPRKRREFVND